MPPAPLTLSGLLGATGVAGIVRLALDPEPFSTGSAALLAIGLGILSVVTIAGALLARGRWSRWTATALAGGWLAVAGVAPLDSLGVAVLIGAAATIGITTGPWLPRWLRHRPAAEGIPPSATVLLLLLIVAPIAVGLGEPSDPEAAGWGFSLWCLLLAAGVGRAMPAALWAGRIFHGPVTVSCSVLLGLPGAVVLGVLGAFQLTLLWRRDVRGSVEPLLPAPSTGVPIPPELMDETIMRSAGLDDRGRPLEDS